MVGREKRSRVSKEELRTTKGVLAPTATITLPSGESLEADVISTTGPMSTVPRFSRDGLDRIASQNPLHHEFFKSLRASQYGDEWERISSLPDRASREWKMVALSFCAQVAIETSAIYPWLEHQALNWLRAKFVEQDLPDDFEARWEAYWNHCGGDLRFIEGRIYLHVEKLIRFRWFGDPPKSMSSLNYQMTVDESPF